MVITIERNQKIKSLQIIDNIYIYIYIYMCVCVCVCARAHVSDYTNSDIKTSKIPKKIYN